MIRLAKSPTTGSSHYRIIVVDRQKKNNGKAVEIIGYFEKRKGLFEIKRPRLDYWLKQGAQMSPALANLLTQPKT